MISFEGIVKLALILAISVSVGKCEDVDQIINEYNKAHYKPSQLLGRDIMYAKATWLSDWCGYPTTAEVERGFRTLLNVKDEDYPHKEVEKVEKAREEFRKKLAEIQEKTPIKRGDLYKLMGNAARDIQSFQAKKLKLLESLDTKVVVHNLHNSPYLTAYEDHGDILRSYKGIPTTRHVEGGFERLLKDFPEGHDELRAKIEKARDDLPKELHEAKSATMFVDTRQFNVLERYKHMLHDFQKMKDTLH